MRYSLFLLPVFLLTIFTQTLHATIIHVPGDSTTIQGGINGAVDGDTVMVSPGTYNEYNINFLGKAITVMGTDPEDSAVVAATVVDAGTVSSVFVFSSGEDLSSVLAGLTITNGLSYDGGGIECLSSSPTIIYCLIFGNVATNRGGGIYCYYSSPIIENNDIYGNSANAAGGIGCDNPSSPAIIDNIIQENEATYNGGGILCNDLSPYIFNNRIINNSSISGVGGGIHLVSVDYSNISFNTITQNSASVGGGINCDGSTPILFSNTIEENSANLGGGISIVNNAFPTIKASTIERNSANLGGGIYIDASSIKISNCRIQGNSAGVGGGIRCVSNSSFLTFQNCIIDSNIAQNRGGGFHFKDTSPTIENCTITENSASSQGGGFNLDNCSAVITNCILWGDSPQEIKEDNGGNNQVTWSDVQGTWPGEGNINTDPLFADPDYHLQSTSPCIDDGNPSILDACLPPGLGAERSDMGAYGGEENCGWPEDLIELIIDPTGPVVIPRGDTLYFSTLIRNNSPNTVVGDFWLNVLLPNSNEILVPSNFLNYANPLSGQIAASDSINLSNELYIPGTAPTGSYLLIGRVGAYPNATIAERWINFLVVE